MYAVGRTDVGLVRDTNQDRYLIWRLDADCGGIARRFSFCAIADGMGGNAAGDRASALALDVLGSRLLPELAGCGGADSLCDIPDILRDAVAAANSAVLQAAAREPALNGMGTTLTVGLLTRGVLHLAQVGDSRCYRLRSGALEQQTADHSVVAEMVRDGRISEEGARKHPGRNVITRAIGAKKDLEVDITCQAVEAGDIYLFCSDGLWELAPAARIERIVIDAIHDNGVSADGLAAVCERLVQTALELGGEDNVTVLVAAVEPDDVHADALREVQALARTRVESASSQTVELKRTLRYRLQAARE
ncbi:MAG TPA: PP2C family serine/threonine-protein phosphatase [Armatimonadota bacterium]|nr:PP2C family serine/threonine-protein phosphatase [Armatimonadota bacterium]